MRKVILGCCLVVGAGLAGWLSYLDHQNRLLWDHWDVVEPGTLYRSGQLNADQLREAVRRYGLKTVVNFQLPSPELLAEKALCKELGVGFVNLPMPGDGFGEEAQFRKVLEILDTPERRPALVHCARGTCRTGSAVSLFRFERDGWTIDDVAAELRRQAYRDEYIAGYIYQMVKMKPSLLQHDPTVVDEYRKEIKEAPVETPENEASAEAVKDAEIAHSKEAGHVH